MLTEDQIRLRIKACYQDHICNGCLATLELLGEVLPDLVAAMQKNEQIAGSRLPDDGLGVRERESSQILLYSYALQHGRECKDCGRNEPCERAKELLGQ